MCSTVVRVLSCISEEMEKPESRLKWVMVPLSDVNGENYPLDGVRRGTDRVFPSTELMKTRDLWRESSCRGHRRPRSEENHAAHETARDKRVEARTGLLW